MFPSLGSQPRCCSRRLLGGSSVPLFSRASSRELVYCTRELAARPVRWLAPVLVVDADAKWARDHAARLVPS